MKFIQHKLAKILPILLIILLFSAQHIFCFSFETKNRIFKPKNNITKKTIFISNPKNEYLPIELKMFRVKPSIKGEDNLAEDKNNFLIVPSQILLRPNEKQSITIKWTGPRIISEEQQYKLSVKTISIKDKIKDKKLKKDKVKINFNIVTNYLYNFYVQPSLQNKKIQLTSVKFLKDSKEPKMKFSFINNGNSIYKFQEIELELKPKYDSSKITTVSIKESKSFRNIFPKSTKQVEIPWKKTKDIMYWNGKITKIKSK
jgi:fimbrial chaperone protein